jgi:hypothetical protein
MYACTYMSEREGEREREGGCIDGWMDRLIEVGKHIGR